MAAICHGRRGSWGARCLDPFVPLPFPPAAPFSRERPVTLSSVSCSFLSFLGSHRGAKWDEGEEFPFVSSNLDQIGWKGDFGNDTQK